MDLDHVVIIGAGTTGVSAFSELVEHNAAKTIDIIDPRDPGKGVAFNNTREELLCNTPAESMSLVSHDKNNFINFMKNKGIIVGPNDCVPRIFVSEYTVNTYNKYVEQAGSKYISHTYRKNTVIRISKRNANDYLIELDSGDTITADKVLICHGYGKPMIPDVLVDHQRKPGIFISPYPEQQMIDSIPEESSVLVLGSKLSAIDAALILSKHHHKVAMASPSGEVPAVRTRAPDLKERLKIDLSDTDFKKESCHLGLLKSMNKTLKCHYSLPLSKQISRNQNSRDRLVEEIKLAENDSIFWQDITLAYLRAANDMLSDDKESIPRNHLVKCLRMCTRYLSAMPISNAEKLLNALDSQAITLKKGKLISVSQSDIKWHIQWEGSEQVEQYDAIVSAAGYTKPTISLTGNDLYVEPNFTGEVSEPVVNADLRFIFHDDIPENIWIIGVASFLRAPLVNGVFQSKEQAAFVRKQIVMQKSNINSGINWL